MEVDDLPLAVAAVPHPGLLGLGGARRAVGVDVLRHSDVGDAGGLVAHQVDVGVQDGGVDRLAVLGPHWYTNTNELPAQVSRTPAVYKTLK